jgi:hypothetical protein
MTLILGAVFGNWAVHASDRHVTVSTTRRNPTGEHDPNANKTVVVTGSDCWLVLGYTGLAYLDGKPTDQVIAEAISGYENLSPDAAFTFWQRLPGLHYREIRDRVEKKLNDAYTRVPRATAEGYPTTVLATGLQRKDGMVTKVMFRTTIKATSSTSVELRPPAQIYKAFRLVGVGACKKEICKRAEELIVSATSVEDVRDILRGAVVATSRLTPRVGDDVMTVILDQSKRKISTAFWPGKNKRLPALFQQVADEDEQQLVASATVATPYILTPGTIYGPSVGTPGGWSSNNGIHFDFTGFGDPPAGGSGMFFGAQPRTTPPT